ncbi:MAG: hypothetical protein NXI20_20485 [bacterium]|nr:hypothetical protein [bacterium]
MKYLLCTLILALYTSGNCQTILFKTDHLTIKKFSQPSKTYETVLTSWVWDSYGTQTILIQEPNSNNPNTIYEIYSLEKIEGRYYLIAKEAYTDYIWEIVIDLRSKTIEVKSLKPVEGIKIKYFESSTSEKTK